MIKVKLSHKMSSVNKVAPTSSKNATIDESKAEFAEAELDLLYAMDKAEVESEFM